MRSNYRSPTDPAEPLIRRVETGDHDRVVIDLGAGADGVSTDVVDDTVIVVGSDDEQYEFDLPSAEARTFIKNGVLTIEVSE